MPYFAFQASAFAGVPVTMPARRQCFVFASAGAIWCVLRLPSPQSAKPSLREACDFSRVALVLMKGAIAKVAAVEVRNLRRESRAMVGSRVLAGAEGTPWVGSVLVKA